MGGGERTCEREGKGEAKGEGKKERGAIDKNDVEY
jgi:hypothetical protein